MKAHWTLAVIGMTALVLASGCSAAGGTVEEVVIGADLELSGPSAGIGKVYAQALQLKIEQVNAEGVLGNRKLTLALRDNRSFASTSVSNVTTLAADKTVAALITGVCGDCSLASVKPINDAKVPTIALALPAAVSSPVAERRYVFKLSPNVNDDATVLLSEITRAGAKKMAIIATEDEYGKEAADSMTSKISKIQGASVVGAPERISAEETNFAAAATRVASKKPDAVIVLAYSPLAGQVSKSLRDAGFTGKLFLGASAADNLFLTGATAKSLDGAGMAFTPTLVSDDIIATSPAKAARLAWFRDYLSKYGTYAAYASFAADAVELIVQAIVDTNSTDRDTLRTAIETSRLDGLSGPLRLSPDNHSALAPQAIAMLVAANGRWRLAS